MGKVGKVLLGAGLIVGGVLLAGVTGGGSLVALAHGVGMAATGIGIGMTSRLLFAHAKMQTRSGEIRQTIANPLAALPVVYGTAKVGLKLADIRSGATLLTSKKLYIVGAVAHGSPAGLGLNAIKRIWFDERLAFDASGTVQRGFKKGVTARAALTKYLGTDNQSADGTMTTAFPSAWTSLHRGRGVAYGVFELTLDQDIYQGIPAITAEVEGAKVLDPRASSVTYSWSRNPALQALDYLLNPIYGMDAGRRVPVVAGDVTNSGMSAFSAANLVDGNPDTQAFHTDTEVPGDYVMWDFGRPVELDRCDIWMAQNPTPGQQWQVQYGDSSGGSFTTISVDAGNPFNPQVERRNTFRWASHGIGAHRYWRLRLNNTPGAGPYINGVDWFESEIDYQSFADEANTCDVTVEEPPPLATFSNVENVPDLSPIRLTITGHGRSTGDVVLVTLEPGYAVSGIKSGGEPIEGRTFTITVVDADHYTLDGTSGSGTYVANSLRSGLANFKVASASTASNPLRLTIAGHGWSTGNRVHVALSAGFSSSGLSDASGYIEGRSYTITVVSSSIISLDGINASGTYVANSLRVGKLVSVPQFQSDGVIDTGQEPQENLRQILSSFRGRVIFQGGKFRCHSKKTTSVSVQFTDEDIRAIRFITPGTREKVNAVRAAFLNGENDWQPEQRDYPRPGEYNSYLEEDNKFSSVLEMDLPFVNSAYQADRLAQVALRESRDGISIEATLGARGMLAQVGDVVGVTYDSPAWSQKQFSVENIALVPDLDTPVLALVEYEPNAYVLSDSQLHSSLPNTGLPDASAAPNPPTNLVLTTADSDLIVHPNASFVTRIRASWDDSDSPFLDYIEVEAKKTAESDYDSWGRPDAETEEFLIGPVSIGQSWDVRIRAVTTLGVASDWVTASITVLPGTRQPAAGVVEFFDDFPGAPARWTAAGSGSESVVTGADARYGGGVLRVIGNRSYLWNTLIPIDQAQLYSMRLRVRKIRENVGGIGGSNLAAGVVCYNSKKEFIDPVFGEVATGASIRSLAMKNVNVPIGSAWTEYIGFARGWNGAWYLPAAGVLSQSGLGNYTAANVGDGNPGTKAFDVDSASSGAALVIDFGAAQSVIRARIYLDAAGSTAQYKIQYATSSGGPWTDVTFRSGATTWTPNLLGWNEVDWNFNIIGSGKQFWRLLLNNTPGAGPDIMEFAVTVLGSFDYTTPPNFSDPDNPMPFPPGTAYISPNLDAIGSPGGASTDGILEIDMVEMPTAAGAIALV